MRETHKWREDKLKWLSNIEIQKDDSENKACIRGPFIPVFILYRILSRTLKNILHYSLSQSLYNPTASMRVGKYSGQSHDCYLNKQERQFGLDDAVPHRMNVVQSTPHY